MPSYITKGTCARQIIYAVENDIITDIKFIGGCSGSHQGICRLAVGCNIDTIIEKLKGIKCKNNTSCPDQLALALIEYKANQGILRV
jgi:uncharacterized protein (TIGR03905 family)